MRRGEAHHRHQFEHEKETLKRSISTPDVNESRIEDLISYGRIMDEAAKLDLWC